MFLIFVCPDQYVCIQTEIKLQHFEYQLILQNISKFGKKRMFFKYKLGYFHKYNAIGDNLQNSDRFLPHSQHYPWPMVACMWSAVSKIVSIVSAFTCHLPTHFLCPNCPPLVSILCCICCDWAVIGVWVLIGQQRCTIGPLGPLNAYSVLDKLLSWDS